METLAQLQARLAALRERVKKDTGAWSNELWIIARGLDLHASDAPPTPPPLDTSSEQR